jgi:hypothetical protein
MDTIWFIAAIWMGLAFAASLISIRTGISVHVWLDFSQKGG